MLLPKRAKYRRQFKGRVRGTAHLGASLAFGEIGLKSLGIGRLSSQQIEAARKAISHETKRGGKLWIRIFPAKPITKKPPEIRMGGGKGPVDHYAAVVRPGTVIFELAGVEHTVAKRALNMAAHKLPIPTRVIED